MPDEAKLNDEAKNIVPSQPTAASVLPISPIPPVPPPASAAKAGFSAPSAPPALAPSGQADNKIASAWNELDKNQEQLFSAATPSKQGNTDIYSMPREFQKHNKVAGSSFSASTIFMAGSVLLFLLVGSAFLLYAANPGLFSKITGINLSDDQSKAPATQVNLPNDSDQIPGADQPTVAVATSTPIATSTDNIEIATSTPVKDLYLTYNKRLHEINTFAEYYTLMLEYGSQYKVSQVESEKLRADSAVDKGQAILLEVKQKTPRVDDTAKFTETINQSNDSLQVDLPDGQSNGVVDFIMENGNWRIDNEDWKLSKQIVSQSYVPGDDRDQDGLSDLEEDLFGSNKELTDTDSDGYSDGQEVKNLYDPAKNNAKLVDSAKIKLYGSVRDSFTVLYPSEWKRSSDQAAGSINFRSDNNHFIQIIEEDNTSGEDLDSYYQRVLGLTQIDEGLRLASDTWQGIATQDGLVVFIISKTDKTKIYAVQYHPGEENILEYKAVFDAMVKSLVLRK